MSRSRLAQYFSAILRLAGLTLVTVAATVSCVVGRYLLRARRSRLKWRNHCFRGWARATAWLAGMRVQVTGKPPNGSFVLVANHLSYMDIIALATQINCAFVAKSEVAGWPLFGWASRNIGTIFVERDTKRSLGAALNKMEGFLADGLGVALFPEGTTSPGTSVGPFKPALLELAAQKKLPVHYAGISYRVPAGEKSAAFSVCWWGEMGFLTHIFNLFGLGGFEAHLTFGAVAIQRSNRKELAEALRQAVDGIFVPTCHANEISIEN